MADPTAISDALDEEYQRREAEAGAFPADLAEVAKTAPYVAERLAKQRGWSPKAAVDPETFAFDAADRLLKAAPDTPDEDVLAIKEWAQRRKGVNAVRAETVAKADKVGFANSFDEGVASVVAPGAKGASDAMFGIPEWWARNVIAPIAGDLMGKGQGTKGQVDEVMAAGAEANPRTAAVSAMVGETVGALPLMRAGTAAGMAAGAGPTAAGLAAGAAYGGAREGTVEGAAKSALFMGATAGLGRFMRGATPGTVRYLGAEMAAGATADALSRAVMDGESDPFMSVANGVVNAIFGVGAARAAGRAKAQAHVANEVAKGREIPDILNDDAIKQMWEESKSYPDPVAEAASTRGEFEARLDEVAAGKPTIPALDPVAEAKATAAEFDARAAPESVAPEKPAPVAPVAAEVAPRAPESTAAAPKGKTLVGKDKRGQEVWEINGKFYTRSGRGPLGAAHPESVAEAKASAQPTAPESTAIESRPTAEVVSRPSVLDAAEKAGYPGAKEAREALDAIPDSTTRWDPAKKEWTRDPVDFTEVEARPIEAVPRDLSEDARWTRDRLESEIERRFPGDDAGRTGVREFGEAVHRLTNGRELDDPATSGFRVGGADHEALTLAQAEARRVVARWSGGRSTDAPSRRPGKAGERGALNLAPVGEFLGEVATGVQRVFGETTTRVRSLKTPAAEETYKKSVAAIDAAKGFRGEMGRELLAAEKLTGQAPFTALGRAATTLSTPTEVPGKTYTEATLYDAIEGNRPPASAEEARIVDVMRKVIGKTGEITEREGLQQKDSAGNYAPFVNRTDKIAPRMTTPDFHEIVQRGPASRAWQPMIDAFADINPGVSRTAVESYFNEMHTEMAAEGPQSTGAKAQAEFTRGFPRVPATIDAGGRTVRLFETNPASYIRRLVEMRAQRLGFVKAFGQDIPDQATPVQNLRDRFTKETGQPQEFVNLTRLLHGHAKDLPFIDPASVSGGVVRNIGRLWSGVREVALSASAVVNAPESIGATQHMVGTRRLGKAIYLAFKGRHAPINAAVDALGATTRDAINASYDPANPRGSASRMFTEISSRIFGRKFVEEFQERVAAIGGKLMADDMQAGKGTDYDVQSLKTMGWDDADARRLAAGRGTQAEYDAVTRKVPSEAVGANQSKGERSWMQNSRAMKPLNFIATYAHNVIRNTASVHKAFVDTMARVIDGSGMTPKQRWAGTFRATQHLAGFYATKTLQGAAASMLGALLGRKSDILTAEAKDDPFKFAVNSFVMATIGGPYAAAARAMFGDGKIAQVSPPVAMSLEALEAFNGNGKYRDLPLSERMAQLATRMAPASRIARSGAVLIGLASAESQDIENARAAYWRWRRDFDKATYTGKEAETEDEQRYRTELKSAYLAMTRGGDPEDVAKRVLSAIGGDEAIGKDKKKAAESIRRRRLLSASAVKGKMDALKSRIGAKAFKALEAHDALLDSLADSVQRGG